MSRRINYLIIGALALIFAITPLSAANFVINNSHMYYVGSDGSKDSKGMQTNLTKVAINQNSTNKKVRPCIGANTTMYACGGWTLRTISTKSEKFKYGGTHKHFYMQEGSTTKYSPK